MENLLLDNHGQPTVTQFLLHYITNPKKTIQTLAPSSAQIRNLLWKVAFLILALLSLTELTPYSHLAGVMVSYVVFTLLMTFFISILMDFFAQMMKLKAQSAILMPWLLISQLPYVLIGPVSGLVNYSPLHAQTLSIVTLLLFITTFWLKLTTLKSLYACSTTQAFVLIISPGLFIVGSIFIFLCLAIFVIGAEFVANLPMQTL